MLSTSFIFFLIFSLKMFFIKFSFLFIIFSLFLISLVFFSSGTLTFIVFLLTSFFSGISNSIFGISKNKFNFHAVNIVAIQNNNTEKVLVASIEFHSNIDISFISQYHIYHHVANILFWFADCNKGNDNITNKKMNDKKLYVKILSFQFAGYKISIIHKDINNP